ncbi:MAG: sulfur carrier protein ThiS adenylyltransferase ThiF [Desulfovibrionaceae bacterium]|nr:sulfur carrier protein ThiS adenylyltransferase ThiF [Desulfovibrionaceae bacterium]
MLHEGLQRYLSPKQRLLLAEARVGIAGMGGLGSNVALMLARSGIDHLLIADGDVVESSNLNRQQFFPRHVGLPKVTAMRMILEELNPQIDVDARHCWLDGARIAKLLPKADIWVEALDAPEAKRLFVEIALQAGYFTVSASGMAGYGGLPMQKRQVGNLVLVGDFISDVNVLPPLAPRVTEAAALQADAVLERILGALSL